MRTLAPFLVVLAAGCSPPPPDLSAITKELAALRQGLEEIRKFEQPKFDSEQAMVDLTKEIQRLRDRMAQPIPAAPVTPATPALQNVQTGMLSGGIGGTQPNVNDLHWVLTKVNVDKEERVVLALYQAVDGGRGFRLNGVRMLNADLQLLEFKNDGPRVKDIVDALRKK
jgi:hypothetical protein